MSFRVILSFLCTDLIALQVIRQDESSRRHIFKSSRSFLFFFILLLRERHFDIEHVHVEKKKLGQNKMKGSVYVTTTVSHKQEYSRLT